MTTTPTSTKRNTKAYKEALAAKQATIIEYMNRVIEAVPSGNAKIKEELVTVTDMLLLFMKKHNAFIVKDHSVTINVTDASRTRQVYRLSLSVYSNILLKQGKKENLAIFKDLFEIEQASAHIANVGNLFNHKTECSVQHSDGSCFTNRTITFSVTLADSKLQ